MRAIWRWGVVLMGSTAMLAQGPPIKMGLWESTHVTDNGDGSPATLKVRQCITPADWEKMVHGASQMPKGCTQSLTKTAHGYTFDAACNLPNSTMKTHGASTFVDSEHIQTVSDTTMTIAGKTRHITSHSNSHFVSAACGAVKPGASDIE